MNKALEQAVERAISAMHDNLAEQVTIDDMARAAMFSKFHFTRVFERATGVSPGRFLSAVRLQRAKQLLVSTPMTVADICFQVGYNSVGTFSSRFSSSVGLSPTAYRRTGGFTTHIPVRGGPDGNVPARAVVQGTIEASESTGHGIVFAGLFPARIPQGNPVRCTILQRPGPYRFETVPAGTWYLLAHSVGAHAQDQARADFAGKGALSVGTLGPIHVRPDSPAQAQVHIANLTLQPMRAVDPPVLLALLDVRTAALARTSAAERLAA